MKTKLAFIFCILFLISACNLKDVSIITYQTIGVAIEQIDKNFDVLTSKLDEESKNKVRETFDKINNKYKSVTTLVLHAWDIQDMIMTETDGSIVERLKTDESEVIASYTKILFEISSLITEIYQIVKK